MADRWWCEHLGEWLDGRHLDDARRLVAISGGRGFHPANQCECPACAHERAAYRETLLADAKARAAKARGAERRRRERAGRARVEQVLRARRSNRRWTASEDARLFRGSAQAVAARLGRSLSAVQSRRAILLQQQQRSVA